MNGLKEHMVGKVLMLLCKQHVNLACSKPYIIMHATNMEIKVIRTRQFHPTVEDVCKLHRTKRGSRNEEILMKKCL